MLRQFNFVSCHQTQNKNKNLNPDYALENVMKVKNTIKISTHGLFWMKKYINILIFKKGVSAYF